MEYGENPIDRLPVRPLRQLRAFVQGADRDALRAVDWHLFYDFIKSCHIHEVDLPGDSLVHFLRAGGFPERATAELGLVYAHARAMLVSRGPAQEQWD